MSVEPLAARAERPPHPALAGLVTVTGYRHVMPAPGVHHGLPSGELTAILALDEPIDVAWARGDPSEDGTRRWSPGCTRCRR